jgi:hypothetical protein
MEKAHQPCAWDSTKLVVASSAALNEVAAFMGGALGKQWPEAIRVLAAERPAAGMASAICMPLPGADDHALVLECSARYVALKAAPALPQLDPVERPPAELVDMLDSSDSDSEAQHIVTEPQFQLPRPGLQLTTPPGLQCDVGCRSLHLRSASQYLGH